MSIFVYNVSPRIQYTAAAAQVVFTVPFAFFVNTDLLVYLTPGGTDCDDAANILALNVNYTVAGADNENGGTITLLVGATFGDIITIIRDMPEDRLSKYISGGLFTADQVNDDFSMDVMMNQQNEMRIATLTPHYSNSCPVAAFDVELPLLGASQIWQMNAAQNEILAVSLGAVTSVSTTTTVTITVNQAAHGFIAGDVVKSIGTNTYAKAQANSAANAEVAGIVLSVTNANTFVLLVEGIVTGLAGLTPGATYYLDPTTAGGFTATAPVTNGQVIKPIFISIGAASAIWVNQLGALVSSTSGAVTILVAQALHGLVIGNAVLINGAGAYVKAQANSAANAEVVGIVTVVTDVNNFVLQLAGYITSGLGALVAGSVYYLDPATPGAITVTRPTTVTQVIKPLLVAQSATTGIWINLLGTVL